MLHPRHLPRDGTAGASFVTTFTMRMDRALSASQRSLLQDLPKMNAAKSVQNVLKSFQGSVTSVKLVKTGTAPPTPAKVGDGAYSGDTTGAPNNYFDLSCEASYKKSYNTSARFLSAPEKVYELAASSKRRNVTVRACGDFDIHLFARQDSVNGKHVSQPPCVDVGTDPHYLEMSPSTSLTSCDPDQWSAITAETMWFVAEPNAKYFIFVDGFDPTRAPGPLGVEPYEGFERYWSYGRYNMTIKSTPIA